MPDGKAPLTSGTGQALSESVVVNGLTGEACILTTNSSASPIGAVSATATGSAPPRSIRHASHQQHPSRDAFTMATCASSSSRVNTTSSVRYELHPAS